MTSRKLKVATRGSALARWQTQHVVEMLGVECEVVVVTSTGDRNQTSPIVELRAQGAFVKELQAAVLDGRADFAVHSAKDLPAITDDGLCLASVPERADARDVLVGSTLAQLPVGALIGTGSLRRRAQLLSARPDLTFGELRGNIDTRLSKAKNFDAIVLAAAGIKRLGRADEITEYFSTDVMVPQVGQGALAVECRKEDAELISLLQQIQNPECRAAVDAERSFLAELGGACHLPEGAYATVSSGAVTLTGALASIGGDINLRYELTGVDPVQVGRDVAHHILEEMGGKALMDSIKNDA